MSALSMKQIYKLGRPATFAETSESNPLSGTNLTAGISFIEGCD